MRARRLLSGKGWLSHILKGGAARGQSTGVLVLLCVMVYVVMCVFVCVMVCDDGCVCECACVCVCLCLCVCVICVCVCVRERVLCVWEREGGLCVCDTRVSPVEGARLDRLSGAEQRKGREGQEHSQAHAVRMSVRPYVRMSVCPYVGGRRG